MRFDHYLIKPLWCKQQSTALLVLLVATLLAACGKEPKFDGPPTKYKCVNGNCILSETGTHETVLECEAGCPRERQPCDGEYTFVDPRDGQEYQIAWITGRCWMIENMRYEGDIPEIQEEAVWWQQYDLGASYAAWCHLHNDPNNDAIHGKLYTYVAVRDHDVCPPGWRVPSRGHFMSVVNAFGGMEEASPRMRSQENWSKPNNASNRSWFSATGGGQRRSDGVFSGAGTFAGWWTTDLLYFGDQSYTFFMTNYSDACFAPTHQFSAGLSCRCVKE